MGGERVDSANESVERGVDHARLGGLLDHAPVVLFTFRGEPGRPVAQVSPNVSRWGYDPGDLVDGTVDFPSLLHPDDRAEVLERTTRQLESGPDHLLLRYRIKRCDGAWIPVEDRTWIERGDGGEIRAAHGVLLDLSEQRAIEDRRLESDATLRAIFESVQEGILVIDLAAERVVLANPAACAMLGRTRAELVGSRPLDLHPTGALSRAAEALDGFARGDHGLVSALPFRRGDGTVFRADVGRSLVSLEGHPAYLAVLRDVSEIDAANAALREWERRVEVVLAAGPAVLYTLDLRSSPSRATWVSESLERVLGVAPSEALDPGWWPAHVHPDDQAGAFERQSELTTSGELCHDYRVRHADGHDVWIRDLVRTTRDEAGRVVGAVGAWVDVSVEKRAEAVRALRQTVLERVLAGDPLGAVLERIALEVERIEPGARVSILLVDRSGRQLVHGAAPSLPEAYARAVERLPIAEGQGSCGTAAHRGQAVVVEDVETDPLWADYTEVARAAGIRACWSVPFHHERGQALGTFAVHHASPRAPSARELALVEELGTIAGLAVHEVRASEALRQAAAVFEATRDGVIITDAEQRIVAVNRAFVDITGYTEAEALGQRPMLLGSGRHDEEFFRAMWRELEAKGHWQGEIVNRRKSGEVYPAWLTINAVEEPGGLTQHYVGVFTDISQLKENEARLDRLAHYDPLTQLPNRLLSRRRLEHALERARRRGRQLAVLYLDIDRFKTVNDSLGHPVGDELLGAFSARLSARLRREDTFGRLGGDEFLVVLEEVDRPDAAATVARAIVDAVAAPFRLSNEHDVFVGVSIGISLFPDDADTADALVRHADVAMYQAKQRGRNGFCFHTGAMSEAASERLAVETKLRRALSEDQLLLHYQPLMHGRSGRVTGVEALVRWKPPGEALVPPGKFIPIAEDTGLVVPLGAWVLRRACEQARSFRDAGLGPMVMAVNISARQFQSEDFVGVVQRTLEDTGLPAAQLELELTESLLMTQADAALRTLDALEELGVRISLDDFGTGYSSLAYLKRFPVHKLKIDRSFVLGLAEDAGDRAISATIIAMAKALELEVLAEGVETEAQLACLLEQGCDLHQGYLFHRPAPAEELVGWIAARGVDGPR